MRTRADAYTRKCPASRSRKLYGKILDMATMGKPVIRQRAGADVADVVNQLKAHPGDWVEYSTHATRGAARSRIHALRAGATFRELPVEWTTRRVTSGDILSPVRVYVRWIPDLSGKSSGSKTPERRS